jgi:hypothetical protein
MLSLITLSVVMLSMVVLNVTYKPCMLSVIMLNVITLIVVAPFNRVQQKEFRGLKYLPTVIKSWAGTIKLIIHNLK